MFRFSAGKHGESARRRFLRPAGVLAAVVGLLATFLVALITAAAPASAAELYSPNTPPSGDTSWGGLFYRYQVWNFAPFPLTYYASYSAQADTWWRDGLSATPIGPGEPQAYQLNTHTYGQWNSYWLAYTFEDTLNKDPVTGQPVNYALLITDAYGSVNCQVVKQVGESIDLPASGSPLLPVPSWYAAQPNAPASPPPTVGDVTNSGPWTCGIGYNNNNATATSIADPVANSTDYMFINLLPRNFNATSPTPITVTDPTAGGAIVANVCAGAKLSAHYGPGTVDGNGKPLLAPLQPVTSTRAACTANNASSNLPDGTGTVQQVGDRVIGCPNQRQATTETITNTATVEATTTDSDEINVNFEIGNSAEEGDPVEAKLAIAYSHVFERSYAAGAEVSIARTVSVDPGQEAWLQFGVPTKRSVADWTVTLGNVTYQVNHAFGVFPDLSNATPLPSTGGGAQTLPGYTTPATPTAPASATDLGVLSLHPQPLTNSDYISNCGTQPFLTPRVDPSTPSLTATPINNGDDHCDYASQTFTVWGGSNTASGKVTMKVAGGNLLAGLSLVQDQTPDQYGRFHAQLVGMPVIPANSEYSYPTFNITATAEHRPVRTPQRHAHHNRQLHVPVVHPVVPRHVRHAGGLPDRASGRRRAAGEAQLGGPVRVRGDG